MGSIFGFAESLFKSMFWLLLMLIVAFALLGWLQNAGQGNILGNFAEWINDHARPQAS